MTLPRHAARSAKCVEQHYATRIDLAYAIYAIAHGHTEAEVEAAIRSRDLSHKGTERRQQDYVERTIKKALAATERSR